MSTDDSLLVDSTGQSWNQKEIQALVNQTGSFTKTANRLGIKVGELRKMGILTPPEWVRSKAATDPMWLPNLILQTGSTKTAAELLNVSTTHLNNVLRGLGYETDLPTPDPTEARAALKKFGAVIFAARLLNTTPNLIKQAVPEWREYRDRTKAGSTSVRTGAIGESYVEAVRGDKITHSPAMENHNHPGYDHQDTEYGRVNTKTAVVSDRSTWTWELEPHTDCDAFALVQLDKTRTPVGMVIILKDHVTDLTPPRGFLATPRKGGAIAVSTHTPHPQPIPEPYDMGNDPNPEDNPVLE
jgi:hypothetical protein